MQMRVVILCLQSIQGRAYIQLMEQVEPDLYSLISRSLRIAVKCGNRNRPEQFWFVGYHFSSLQIYVEKERNE